MEDMEDKNYSYSIICGTVASFMWLLLNIETLQSLGFVLVLILVFARV